MGLYVSSEKFEEMLSLPLDNIIKDNYGMDYISWSRAIFLMKKHFPHFAVEVLRSPSGAPVFDLDEDGMERGSMIGVRIRDMETDEVSETYWYPIMGQTQKGRGVKPSQYQPDSRAVNDNLQRAIVRCISIVTGIGFDLFLQMDEEELKEILSLSSAKEETRSRRMAKEDDEEEEKKPSRRRFGKAKDEEPEEDEDDDTDPDDDDDEDEEEKKPSRGRRSRDDDDEDDEDEKPARRGLGRRSLPTRRGR